MNIRGSMLRWKTSSAATSDNQSSRFGNGGGLEEVLERAVEIVRAPEVYLRFADRNGVRHIT
jgi:hypothetical protein